MARDCCCCAMAGCKHSAAQAQHKAANLICMMIPDDVTDAKKRPTRYQRALRGDATIQRRESGPGRALGQFGNVECGEQRYARRDAARGRRHAGDRGRGYAGKHMMAAGMAVGLIGWLAFVLLRLTSTVAMCF